jgi:transposase
MYNCIGIDISKSSINVHIPKNSLDLILENTNKSYKSLYSKLKKLYKKDIDNIVFIYEPTGSYSEALKKFCYVQNIKCFIVNPKQFSNYAKALGVEVKNDINDAQVLSKAIGLAKEEQIKVPIYNEDVETIKELMAYYQLLIKQNTQRKNHHEALSSKDGNKFTLNELKKSIKENIKISQKVLDQIKSIINNNTQYKEDYHNILSIKGIGEIGAIVLLHLFLKYPDANQRQITSLAGLNPIYRQSGTSIQSKSSISKSGSRIYRGILFMGVLSATRHDENFKRFYERLINNGKQTTVAQIAVLRKMIITAHSLYKNKQKYDCNHNIQEKEIL